MIKHIAFPSIDQLRSVIHDVNHQAHYAGTDENGNIIYDANKPKPVISFTGTVKLHGTNAGVCFNTQDGIWAQSRENVITPLKDNAGFAFFVEANKTNFENLFNTVLNREGIDPSEYTVTIYGEWAGCFYYNTPILLADGTSMPIGKIVNKKIDCEVLSYNIETKKLEPKKITGWFKNGKTKDWLTIDIKRRKRGGKSTRLVVTPNHHIFIKQKGEIKEILAGDLKKGDIVLTHGNSLNYSVEQFIRGSLLGDASFADYGSVQIGHSEDNQNGYNQFIQRLLNGICSSGYHISGHGSAIKCFYTQSLPQIKNMHDCLVKNGIKSPTKEFLNKLHPMGLAAWYMDDGSLINQGNGRQYQLDLHTMGFSFQENEIIRDWFNEHGYECYIIILNKYNETRYAIRFSVEGAKSFLSVISPYVIECFNYKLPSVLQSIPKIPWEFALNEYENSLVETTVENIKIGNPYENIDNSKLEKYDIQIEDNHNYFANHVLVHNSGVQRGVAISQLDHKAFFIFGVKISKPEDEKFKAYWVDCTNLSDSEHNIYNVNDYVNYSIDIDFTHPELAQNKLIELVEAVEAECPIGKAFGVSGLGEGIVWVGNWNGNSYRFKTKGEKHSVSKVKTLAAVDVDKINSIVEFVDYAVTKNRYDQAVEKVFGSPEQIDIKKMGDLIRWMVNDITKEETDTMVANNIEPKDVNKYISEATRKMFFESYNKG